MEYIEMNSSQIMMIAMSRDGANGVTEAIDN